MAAYEKGTGQDLFETRHVPRLRIMLSSQPIIRQLTQLPSSPRREVSVIGGLVLEESPNSFSVGNTVSGGRLKVARQLPFERCSRGVQSAFDCLLAVLPDEQLLERTRFNQPRDAEAQGGKRVAGNHPPAYH